MRLVRIVHLHQGGFSKQAAFGKEEKRTKRQCSNVAAPAFEWSGNKDGLFL